MKELSNNPFRGTQMVRSVLASLLIGSMAASASLEKSNQLALDSKIDSINAKRGVVIGGSIRGVYQASYFESDQDLDAVNTAPDVERPQFVTADLDFHLRPWESVRVNALLRLQAGMQDYFASPAKSISAAWLNTEGNVGNNFYWVAGDFRQQYSPLTLYAPSVEVMYEPDVYARDRHMARNHALLEGNQRNLQGVNMQYRLGEEGWFGELRAEGLFSRLRKVGVLDLTGAEGNLLPGDSVAGASLAGNMDKYLGAVNVEWLPMDKNLLLGLTHLRVLDDEDTYTKTQRKVGKVYTAQYINPFDTSAQQTAVTSVRVGGDVARMLEMPGWDLDLTAEMALSTDRIGDSVDLDGQAVLANLRAGYAQDKLWSARLDANYLVNDSGWFNNVAQSSQFFASRVMHSEKDGNTVKYGVNSPLYTTFDALYHYNPKFTPASTNLKTDKLVGTNSYDIAPYSKSSWTSAVLNRSELELVNRMTDPALQLALPNGLATANRKGLSANAVMGWNQLVEAQLLLNMLSQNQALEGLEIADYTEYGAGAKWDVLKTLGFALPLEISGSYKHANRTQGDAELNNDFVNAGLHGRYHSRLGYTAGYQRINTELNVAAANPLYVASPGYEVPLVKGLQQQWMVGLDYTLAANAWLSLSYGYLWVENTYQSADGLATGANMPDYAVLEDGATSYTHKFSQSLVEATVNVDF